MYFDRTMFRSNFILTGFTLGSPFLLWAGSLWRRREAVKGQAHSTISMSYCQDLVMNRHSGEGPSQ